jgi:hypothetical protein
VPPLIDREDVMVACQIRRDLVPAVRRLRGTVDEQERRLPLRSPIQEVNAELTEIRDTVARRGHGWVYRRAAAKSTARAASGM